MSKNEITTNIPANMNNNLPKFCFVCGRKLNYKSYRTKGHYNQETGEYHEGRERMRVSCWMKYLIFHDHDDFLFEKNMEGNWCRIPLFTF